MLYDLIRQGEKAKVREPMSFDTLTHIFDVSDVARFYYEESEKEFWQVEDFAPVTMQWDMIFMEWRLPATINSHGRIMPNQLAGAQMGVWIHCLPLTEPAKMGEVDEAAYQKFLFDHMVNSAVATHSPALGMLMMLTPAELWAMVPPADREAVISSRKKAANIMGELKITNMYAVALWVYVMPKPPTLTYLYTIPVGEDRSIAQVTLSDGKRPVVDVTREGERHVTGTEEQHALTLTHVPLLALKMFATGQAVLEPIPDGGGREQMIVKPWVSV